MKNIKTEVNFVTELKTSNIAQYGIHAHKAGDYLEKAIADLLNANPTVKMLTMDRFSENNVICSTVFDAVISKLPKADKELAQATSAERKAMPETRRKRAEALNKKGRRYTMAIINGALGQLTGAPKAGAKTGATKVTKTEYDRDLDVIKKRQEKRANLKDPSEMDIKVAAFWTKVMDEYKATFKPH